MIIRLLRNEIVGLQCSLNFIIIFHYNSLEITRFICNKGVPQRIFCGQEGAFIVLLHKCAPQREKKMLMRNGEQKGASSKMQMTEEVRLL